MDDEERGISPSFKAFLFGFLMCSIFVILLLLFNGWDFNKAIGYSGNFSKSVSNVSEVNNNSDSKEPLEKNRGQSEKEKSYKVVKVVDGDTIDVDIDGNTQRVRLIGVDTPETVHPNKDKECYGEEASNYLKKLLFNKKVSLTADDTQSDKDKYDRLLRYVALNSEDVGLKIISGGYGKEYTYDNAYKKQSEYIKAQKTAKNNGKGLWGGCKAEKTKTNNTSKSSSASKSSNASNAGDTGKNCNIKGNISTYGGQKIYHMPGQRYYNSTQINLPGERYFCSEAEAQAAGFRKSKI